MKASKAALAEAGVNPQRGEVAVLLVKDGKLRSFALRPTFQAISEIEAVCGGIVGLLWKFRREQYEVQDLVVVLKAGLAAATPPGMPKPSFLEVGELAMATGPINLVEAAARFLGSALSAGQSEEELAAAAQGKDAAPASPPPTSGAFSDSAATPRDSAGTPSASGPPPPPRSSPPSTA